ncbi:amino acid ABC transporter permease [Comamonadaceae bacterium G21597-S1]|nr:amino acid ABC transporter permease [Comamonadaceae bacterium G21597-S1]
MTVFRSFGSDELALLLQGAQWTVGLSLMAFVGGSVFGLLIAVMRVSAFKPFNLLAIGYIQIIQGTPLLGQLFVCFFGLSILGYDVSPWVAAAISLTCFSSAFLGEIWRGCIQAVPKQQWEASVALGMSPAQQYRHVILPQAIRIAIPSTVGFMVQIIKNTSLASTIGFVELLRAGQTVNAATLQPFTVYLVVAGIYFCLCFPLSTYSRILEQNVNAAYSR